ncbi:MAG: hypothetical protein ACK5HO_11735 [Pseudomonadota bacterium]
MKPATASDDSGAFSAQKSIFGPECIALRFKPRKSIFEFALRARKLTIGDSKDRVAMGAVLKRYLRSQRRP